MILFESIYILIARRYGIIDTPTARSSHKNAYPTGGGILFLFGVLLYGCVFGFNYPWFMIGLLLIGTVSFVDDIHPLPKTFRLTVQIVAMLLMFKQFGILTWQEWWIVPIALVICVGITNAYNFMDGINGMTAGYSLAVLAPLIYLNRQLHFISPEYLYITALSLIVFSYYNFRKKAKCFAGDAGSISMAFIMLYALGLLIQTTGNFAYITLLAVYGADTVLTICHRCMMHENLGQAHRKHAYQLMANELKIPHITVSLIYMLLQLMISLGMIFIPINNYLYMGIILAILAIIYIIFIRTNYHLHEEYIKSRE